jgi:hypothetical protein
MRMITYALYAPVCCRRLSEHGLSTPDHANDLNIYRWLLDGKISAIHVLCCNDRRACRPDLYCHNLLHVPRQGSADRRVLLIGQPRF